MPLSTLRRAFARYQRVSQLAVLGAALGAGGTAHAQTTGLDPVTGEAVLAPSPYTGVLSADAPPSAFSSDLALVGRLADGETRGIALVGDVLYRSNGGYLETLDVTTPTTPVVLDHILMEQGVVQGVFVQGSLAYVPVSRGAPYATRGSLQIVDVSDPANLQMVGQVAGRSFFEVFVSGTTAYGAAAGGGLRLFDVSTPSAPVAQGFLTVSGGSVLSVVVEGELAYLAAGNAGFRVVDVADPAAPAVLGSLDVGGFATRVVIEGTRAYVAVNNVGLVVVNIANPASPALLGTFAISSSQVRSVAVDGTTAYVGRDDGFVAVDVTNPAAMTLLGETDFGVTGSGQSIVLDGATAYVGNRYSGVRVLDVSIPADPTEVHLIENGGFSFKVNVVGNIAYVSDLIGQVRLVDLSTPEAPVMLGRAYTPSNTSSVDVAGTTAYVVDRGGAETSGLLTRVDVSDPTAPVVLGSTPTGGAAFGIDIDVADLGVPVAYVANGYSTSGGTDGSFLSVNIAASPVILDEAAPGNQAFDVRVADNKAYVATFGSGLSIFDVTNPTAMAPLSLNAVGNFASSLEVDGTTVYMADAVFGSPQALSIIDVSDPGTPTLLGTGAGFNGGTAVDVAYGSDRAYITVDQVGLYEYDVTDPTAPVAQPVLPTADRPTGVDVEGRLVVLVDAGAGVWIFQTPIVVAGEAAPQAALAVTAAPNPTAGAARLQLSMAEAADVQVEVFSVLGQRVASLDLGAMAAGTHAIELDGRTWAAGVYVYRLTASGQTATGRLTVTR